MTKNLFLVDQRTLDRASRHIAFYTRKMCELFAVHPARRDSRWEVRAERLFDYKRRLNAWFETNGLV